MHKYICIQNHFPFSRNLKPFRIYYAIKSYQYDKAEYDIWSEKPNKYNRGYIGWLRQNDFETLFRKID